MPVLDAAKTLTSGRFGAPRVTRMYSTFFETSNLFQIGSTNNNSEKIYKKLTWPKVWATQLAAPGPAYDEQPAAAALYAL